MGMAGYVYGHHVGRMAGFGGCVGPCSLLPQQGAGLPETCGFHGFCFFVFRNHFLAASGAVTTVSGHIANWMLRRVVCWFF
jgi:hypothetical protein